MWLLSVFCLTFVALSCVLGVFSRTFQDNIVQRIGLAGLCLGCAAGVWEIMHTQYAANRWVVIHASMAIYAMGTFYKVAKLNALWRRWQRYFGNRRFVRDRRDETSM